jgi:chromosome segregation ATPase
VRGISVISLYHTQRNFLFLNYYKISLKKEFRRGLKIVEEVILNMESLKQPTTVISAVTLTGLVGTSVYFYRRGNQLQEELTEVNKSSAATTKKVALLATEIGNSKLAVDGIGEQLQNLQAQLEAQNQSLYNLQTLFENHEERFSEFQAFAENLYKYLKDKDAALQLTVPKKRRVKKAAVFSKVQGKKSAKKKVVIEEPEESTEEEESSAESSEEEVKPTRGKKTPAKAQKGKGKGKVKKESSDDEDDDDDEEDVKAQIAAARAKKNKSN